RGRSRPRADPPREREAGNSRLDGDERPHRPEDQVPIPWVEGYASRTSLRPGETITLHVGTNPASPFVVDLYRMGYYKGLGARHGRGRGPSAGRAQPAPPIGVMRLRECAWEPCATLTIPADWPSGVYLGKLTAEREEFQSYIIFVVRDDRPADFLFQVSDESL